MRVSFKLDNLKLLVNDIGPGRVNNARILLFVDGVAGTSCQLPQSSATIANSLCQLFKENRCQPRVRNLVSCCSVYTESSQKLANFGRQLRCERGFMLYFPHKDHKTNPNHR